MPDELKNFRKICLKVHHLDSAKFLSPSRLAWQVASKKTKLKLELSTDIDLLLMVEQVIRGEICHVIHWYTKINDKYIRDHDKTKELT